MTQLYAFCATVLLSAAPVLMTTPASAQSSDSTTSTACPATHYSCGPGLCCPR